MSSNDLENTSEKLPTAESQPQDTSQGIHMEMETQTSEVGVTKRKMAKRSKAWDFFKRVKSDTPGLEKAECMFCNTQLLCDSKKSGTKGLLYHVNHCKQNPANGQKTVLSYIPPEVKDGDDSVGALKNWRFDQEAVRKALSYMVVVDELPFRFVERSGFQHFMRVACPLFSIPSRITVGRDCYALYEEEKMKLKSLLKKSAQRVCLTTDTWTSIQRVNYLCLTAHFIDNDWNLNKRILSFVPISSHRGEDIGIVIENCLADWGIANIFTITVDNAGSNNTAIAYLKKRLASRSGCILQGRYLHMRCIAHIINLVVNDGLKSMKHSISRIRNAVRYVRQSPSRWDKFKQCIAMENIESKSHVCLDVRTRWNSTYLMLESAVKFEQAFDRLELLDPFFRIELGWKDLPEPDDNDDDGCADYEENQNNEEGNGVPSKSDWENAKRFVGFLEHFYTLTVRVSGSRYVTSNVFFTEISDILYLLEEWQRASDKELAAMALRMKMKYDKYWGNVKNMNMIIYIAVVLDPRYKLDYLQWVLNESYKSGPGDKQNEDDNLGEMVKKALHEMFNEYMRINNCAVGGRKEGSGTSSLESNADGGIGGTGKGSKLVSLYMMHRSRATNEENRTELDSYLREETANNNAEFDILGWWKLNSPRFPILSQMARDILVVPISTVASESAFSTSGRILDEFRSSLTPRIVEALICTQDWIRSRTNQSNICVAEDIAEIEKLDEDLVQSLNRDSGTLSNSMKN